MATLPSNIEQRINDDADAYASNMREGRASDSRDGYVIGATECATRAQALANTLERVNLFLIEQSENAEYPNVRRRASKLSDEVDTALQSWNQKEGV